MAHLFELVIVGFWAGLLLRHTARLYRLAIVPVTVERRTYVRSKLERMWWWLGREEFWNDTQRDTVRCIEATTLVLVVALRL